MKTIPGQRYNYEIYDGQYIPRSVNYNENFPKGDNGRYLYVNKDFDTLDEQGKLDVMNLPGPTYKDGKASPRTSPRVIFAVRELASGTELKYGLDYKLGANNNPGKDMIATIEKMTGKTLTVGDSFDFADYFGPGTKFSAKAAKGPTGYDAIDKDSIMPFGVVSDGTQGESVVTPAQSSDADILLRIMRERKASLNGQEKGVMITMLSNWKNDGLLSELGGREFNAWKTIRDGNLIEFDADGKFAIP